MIEADSVVVDVARAMGNGQLNKNSMQRYVQLTLTVFFLPLPMPNTHLAQPEYYPPRHTVSDV